MKCPACGNKLAEGQLNDENTYVCAKCGFSADSDRELEAEQRYYAAKRENAELQHKLDDINGQLSRQLAANSIGSRKIDELSLQFLNAGGIAIQCQKYAREVESRLLIAIADAESLAAVLAQTEDYLYGDMSHTTLAAELKRHEACAKLYKAEGG